MYSGGQHDSTRRIQFRVFLALCRRLIANSINKIERRQNTQGIIYIRTYMYTYLCMYAHCIQVRALGASRFYRVQTKQTDKVETTTKCNLNRGSRVCMMNQQPTGPVASKFSHTFIKNKLLLNIITNFIVSILVVQFSCCYFCLPANFRHNSHDICLNLCLIKNCVIYINQHRQRRSRIPLQYE